MISKEYTKYGIMLSVENTFGEWLQGPKISPPGLHDIRRAGALQMLRNGADLAYISRYLGHE